MFNTLTFTAGEEYTTDGKPKYDAVIQKFELYCNPKNNETYARYLFQTRLQEEHETFDHFVVDLKNQSKKCNFICTKCQDTTFRDSMIKDQIVIGVNHENLQEWLLCDTNLNLDSAISTCLATEAARQRMKSLSITRDNKPN